MQAEQEVDKGVAVMRGITKDALAGVYPLLPPGLPSLASSSSALLQCRHPWSDLQPVQAPFKRVKIHIRAPSIQQTQYSNKISNHRGLANY